VRLVIGASGWSGLLSVFLLAGFDDTHGLLPEIGEATNHTNASGYEFRDSRKGFTMFDTQFHDFESGLYIVADFKVQGTVLVNRSGSANYAVVRVADKAGLALLTHLVGEYLVDRRILIVVLSGLIKEFLILGEFGTVEMKVNNHFKNLLIVFYLNIELYS